MSGNLGDVAEELRSAAVVARRAIVSSAGLVSPASRDEVTMRLARAVVELGRAAVEFDACCGMVDPVVFPQKWFDTCQHIDCQAWPTWRVIDATGKVVRGSYNCDEHRPEEQPRVSGERYEHRIDGVQR